MHDNDDDDDDDDYDDDDDDGSRSTDEREHRTSSESFTARLSAELRSPRFAPRCIRTNLIMSSIYIYIFFFLLFSFLTRQESRSPVHPTKLTTVFDPGPADSN